MKYCVHFTKDFRYMEEVDEIMLDYNEVNPNLAEVVKKYKEEQRIIVNVTNLYYTKAEESLEIFKETAKNHSNIAFLTIAGDRELIECCKENNIDFFYNVHVNSPDLLTQMIEEGVSDIYLTDDFAFNFSSCQQYLQNKNVNIRIYPNVAQSSVRKFNTNNVRKFYIRPEDIPFYDYDNVIFEFFGEVNRQSVYYEIYTSQKWIGTLGQLIIGLEDIDIDNRTIMPIFGKMRAGCGKSCAYAGNCNICERIEGLASVMKEAEIGFKKE